MILPAIFNKHCETGTEFISYYDNESGCIYDRDEKVVECNGYYPTLQIVSNCGTDEEEIDGEIKYDNLNCINSEFIVLCDIEYEAASDTCLMTIYNNDKPFQAINAKIGICSEVHGEHFSYSILFYSDGDDIVFHTFFDSLCEVPNGAPLKIKNNYFDENMDWKYECNTIPRIGKFVASIYYDDNSKIILIMVII